MIYCCGVYHSPIQTTFLLPNFKYNDRKLEIYICSNCGKIAAQLSQFNVQTKQYETYKPKSRKRTEEFIKKIKNGKFDEIKLRYGTKERAGFVYGVNIQYKNGKIRQYAVDFNRQKNLVKVLDLKNNERENVTIG